MPSCKKIRISLFFIITLAITYAQAMPPQTILFVCGGNTGRSVMAEWYTRHNYAIKDLTIFSRGSGIDPDDAPAVEANAATLIEENGEATPEMIALQRATAIDITDIYKASVVLTMGPKYSERLNSLIDRECSDFNLNYPGRSFSQAQWNAMCQAKLALKQKIHTLVSCASGTEGEIPDPYQQPMTEYRKIRSMLVNNIALVMDNFIHSSPSRWCQIRSNDIRR